MPVVAALPASSGRRPGLALGLVSHGSHCQAESPALRTGLNYDSLRLDSDRLARWTVDTVTVTVAGSAAAPAGAAAGRPASDGHGHGGSGSTRTRPESHRRRDLSLS